MKVKINEPSFEIFVKNQFITQFFVHINTLLEYFMLLKSPLEEGVN